MNNGHRFFNRREECPTFAVRKRSGVLSISRLFSFSSLDRERKKEKDGLKRTMGPSYQFTDILSTEPQDGKMYRLTTRHTKGSEYGYNPVEKWCSHSGKRVDRRSRSDSKTNFTAQQEHIIRQTSFKDRPRIRQMGKKKGVGSEDLTPKSVHSPYPAWRYARSTSAKYRS